jgi:hypothetical protein
MYVKMYNMQLDQEIIPFQIKQVHLFYVLPKLSVSIVLTFISLEGLDI